MGHAYYREHRQDDRRARGEPDHRERPHHTADRPCERKDPSEDFEHAPELLLASRRRSSVWRDHPAVALQRRLPPAQNGGEAAARQESDCRQSPSGGRSPRTARGGGARRVFGGGGPGPPNGGAPIRPVKQVLRKGWGSPPPGSRS